MRSPVLATILALAACSEETVPGTPLFDASFPDVVTTFPPRDGGGDGDAVEGGVEGGLPFACVGVPFDVRASAPGAELAIAVGGGASDFLVAWTVRTAGVSDLYARQVPGEGALGDTWPITEDELVQSSPAVLATGDTWLLAYTEDGLAPDVFTYGLDPADPIGAPRVNVSNDVSADATPRLFAGSAGPVLVWHKPSTQRMEVTSLEPDGTPGTIRFVDADAITPTLFATAPHVFDRGTAGSALFYRSSLDEIAYFPIDGDGLSAGEGATTLTADGSTERLAFSRAGSSGRLFVGAASSILMRAFTTGGAPTGSTTTAPTSGTSERAPAALGLPQAHVLAYRTMSGATPTLRVATLAPANGAILADVAIATLSSLDGDVAIARSAEGDVLLVYTDEDDGDVAIRAARLTCE